MKKIIITLIVIAIICITTFVAWSFTQPGKFFWNQININHQITKNDAVNCGSSGFDGENNWDIKCECDGKIINQIALGATNKYCAGKCGQCECFETPFDLSTNKSGETKKVECPDEIKNKHK